MTTELNEPKAPILIDVVQKQYKNGMRLEELARLYDVKQETLEPIVRDIRQKERKICNEEFHYKNLSRDELIEALERKPTAFSFKRFAGIRSNEEMWALLEQHGLSHMILTKEQEVEERNRQIVKALDSGTSHKDVAKQLGISTSTVKLAAQTLGRTDLKRTLISAEKREMLAEAIKQRVDTMTNKEIMAELGINQNQLSKLRREYKIKPAKRDKTNQFNRERHDGKAKRAKEENRVNGTESHTLDYRELANRIGRLFEQGMTMAEVIEETGISRATYYRVKAARGADWNIVDGRKERHKKAQQPKEHKAPHLVIPEEPKEEPPVKETTTASLESAVTAFKAEEVSELIGTVQKHIEHKKPSTRVINRDKDVWGEYLSARSQEIHDVTHDVEVVVEDGKLIERTTIQYTLERELTK